MLRLTPVFVTSLALAVLAVGVASPGAAAQPKEVKVRVICHPHGEGAASVTVDPWLLLLEVGNVTRWKLHITQPKNNEIIVEPKDGQSWPYTVKKHKGENEVEASGMEEDPVGEYSYNIKFFCNDVGTVIDPRVRVR